MPYAASASVIASVTRAIAGGEASVGGDGDREAVSTWAVSRTASPPAASKARGRPAHLAARPARPGEHPGRDADRDTYEYVHHSDASELRAGRSELGEDQA